MKLFFRRYGEGPPLIILHGLYGSSDNWVTIAKKISGKFTVYLPDQRNHGGSPHSDIHDYDSMSNDLLEFARDHGLSRFFLTGHSMGGKTAVRFAMQWPEMIEGLVIADISPFTDENRRSAAFREINSILNTMLDTDLSSAGSRAEAEIIIAKKINDEKTRGFLMKNLRRDDANRYRWKLNAPALLKNLDSIIDGLPRPDSDYQQVTGFPVLFLKGERSEYLTEKDFGDILKIFPGAEMRIIKGAGHWLHADNPEEVSEALLSQLDR